ncbi:hypothetical protein KP509_02G073000 [Ceratopteris richardii]|uniref:Clustered mitochondria protein homolog n=4 Tax=Ceratopteris richardii TaxID=49495 RepID=A0A8T2VFE9_CERRI|nr:hypothetical protein KP509_02G073000 [Ceratopteris richardii]KAH7444316.1 hypothetical protein KP509_02G073000 [Ceratopteris richardii]
MAGKTNKKVKGKSNVGTDDNENHIEGPAEGNGSLETESLDADADASNENEVKEAEASMETQNSQGDANKVSGVTEENTAENPDAVANPDKVDPNKSEGHSEGQLQLYPMAVKGPSGEHVELQVNPVDSVMDLRQFLLDAPETCFYTCYDLILQVKDGAKHHLADFYEIGDVADVTSGNCTLEMVNAVYDDRSVRTHVRRTRELLSTSSIHSSFSTALAMENEAKNKADSGSSKEEAPELEGLGFMEDPAAQLENLVASPSLPEITCVESIGFSSFNPVPGFRRLQGDLMYLDIHTLEGKKFCVTAHTRGFFVNASGGVILDRRPAHPRRESTTLVGLLRQLSEKFSKGFIEVLERKAQGHPFENVPSLLPCNPWLGPYPPPAHKRDVARAEDALTLPYGSETVGMQRDWNEELQSCREFPRKTLQDRIMRDRALYKVNCDFADAAMKGAKGVIGRCIPPINPTDPERFHMYVHNNIFFSFAMDGDFTLMQQMHDQGSKDASKAEEKDSSKIADNLSKAIGVEPNVEQVQESPSAGALDSEGSASLQGADSEQATYASANNDLKGTKAYNNADVPGLYTLAMAIIDYRGHRIVAQSIIPGILQGDKSESLLYGSVDNGKKIFWNEKFHEKVLEAGKLLHIKEHEVLDGSGAMVKIAAPVECKGIIGSDDRHYILDLMRTTPRDANYTGPGFRHSVLRPELVAAYCQAEALAKAKGKDGEDEVDDKSLNQVDLLSIKLNPNVFTEFKLAGDPEEITADEERVRKAGKYLLDTVLPKFVQDLGSLEVSPMDGQTLTEALHAHGINMRYLGQVANLSKHLPHIWDLCIVEVVTRTAKHVLKGILRATQDHDVGGAIAHFLNCYTGHDIPQSASIGNIEKSPEVSTTQPHGKSGSSEKGKKKGKSGRKSADSVGSDNNSTGLIKDDTTSPASYLCVTSDLIWKDIREAVKFKYQFDLPDDALSKVKRISSIRNLCQKVGITLAARKYDFEAQTPFKTSDILDLHAVVKHSVPMCADARDLLESGKLKLAQGKLPEAYELFSEGFSVLQQVCGPMHREVANCCRYLAMVLYHAGDMAGAIMQQHKELIINERCLGLDHPDTAHSYGNMALFYHGLNQTELALRHMSRALLLLNVSSGSDHPDVAATFINVAMMYQDIQRMNVALRYLQEALQKNLRLLGEEHIQTAVCYHALAIVFNCIGAYKLSSQHEKSTYNILAKQLGEEDTRTKDSANWLKTFQQREAQAKNSPAVSMATAQKAADVLKARPDLLQAFQAAAAGGGSSRGALNKAAAAAAAAALIGERENLPRSRGLDERGARAKADVRKRAAAKGVNIRSQGVPVQALPELLNLSSNAQRKKRVEEPSSSASSANKEKAEQNEHDKNVSQKDGTWTESPANPKKDAQSSTIGQTPLGLGTGLGALETKKAKQKEKPMKAVTS